MTSTERLVAALEIEQKLLPEGHHRQFAQLVIDRAKAFHYHDFKSPHAAPKHELVEQLRQLNMRELAKRVINGEFDEGRED